MSDVTMEKIVSLAKRRSFIFPGSEIYGGLANTWDYGPYGVELKNNVKRLWWKNFVNDREDMTGVDAAILMNQKVWEASGHVNAFGDPLLDCKNCKERFRGDKLLEEKLNKPFPNIFQKFIESLKDKKLLMLKQEDPREFQLQCILPLLKEYEIICPSCGSKNFTEARSFNLMFRTYQGVVEEKQSLVYLRPETAQGIFVNFKNILNSARKRIPFGIAQIGKAFRNEITPGNFTFRTREFDQMEIEYFVRPPKNEEDKNKIKKIFNEWKEICLNWYLDLGIKKDKLRYREHTKEELSHYSTMTSDLEYEFPFGWGELLGIAYRGDFDLKQHGHYSKEDLTYSDPNTNEKYIPHVIEPSFGTDRTVLTFLIDAYDEDEALSVKPGKPVEKRIVLRFHPKLAPIKIAILPLVNKDNLPEVSRKIFEALKQRFSCEYDDSGSIGKRYRRQDEIGTPFAVTIDYQTLEDKTVTVRDRDTMKQERIAIDDLEKYFEEKLK